MLAMLRRSLLPVLLLALTAAYGADERHLPGSAQDLQYGEALFHFYQQDWFNSIIRLQIAQQQQALPNHDAEAELLLGGLDLSYGLRNEAARIFGQLLDTYAADDTTRNRAWYYLARIAWQRGDPDAALDALGHLEGEMSSGTRVESVLLNGLVLMHQQRYEEAISVFEAARAGKVWTPYLAYNLGVAQIRQGLLAEGARTLASLGEISGQREELRALRDKANLALGFSYLQRGDAEQSRAVLQRVRLQGPLSNKALLGSGWADAEAEQYAHALVPWQELGGRDPADPAVQEALLAAPYAMTKLQRHGAAVTQYGAAINTLLEEKAQLDAAIRSIRNGELLDILEQQDPRNGGGWLHQLALDTGSPVLRYQTTLMASHEFQEAVKNYLDLITLLNNLESWSEKTGAFDEILAARRQLYAMHEPAAAGGVRDTRRARLEQRHRELSARLEAARQSNDPVAIARTEDLARWNRLQEIGQQLERMPTDDRVERMRRKQQRLSGVLLWDLNRQFKARLHETRQELEEVGELLGVTNDTQQRLQDTRRMSPAQFTALGSRIGSGNRTIVSLLDRTRELRQAQGEQIEQMAVAELQRQQKRIDIYVVQARFSMAQTYDLALQGQNGRSP